MTDDQKAIEELTAKVAELEAKAAELETDRDKWKGLSRKNEERAATNAERAKRADELDSEIQRLNGELETVRTENSDLKGTLTAKDREVLVQRVAAEKKVPAKYLTGDTEDDLVRAADEFLNDIQAIAPERPSGVVPSAGTGDPKPRASSVEDAKARAAALYAPGK